MSHPSYAAPPPKYRPRARWWVVGVVLLLLAGLCFAGGLFWALRPLAQEDAVITAGEGPVTVDLPAGEERAVYARVGEPVACTAVDADGATVELRRISGDFTYDDWTAQQRFDTGAGDVVLDCTTVDPGSEVRVAQLPTTARFVTGLVLAIGGPVLFGLGGFVVLVVTGILYATRAPRPRRP